MPALASSDTSPAPAAFVARQPILDRRRCLMGYELLFRSGWENCYRCDDQDRASRIVIDDSLSLFGLDSLVGEHLAFINLTRQVIVEGTASVLPPGRVVLEVLESVTPDDEVLAALKALKRAGFKLALDDFVLRPELEPLLDLADIVKVDFLTTPGPERRRVVDVTTGRPGLSLLAERVETQAEFQEGAELGYEAFQGYFFCRPEIVQGQRLPASKLSYLRFLQAINAPQLVLEDVEKVVRQEVSLSVRLLRYLNSAALGLRSKVTSIRHALAMLGERPLRKWAHLISVTSLGEDKPSELTVLCLLRARLSELVAQASPSLRHRDSDLFLVGLLSAIDAVLDRPREEVLREIAVADEIRTAVLGDGSLLGQVLALVLAYERADWENVTAAARRLQVVEPDLPALYAQAVAWSQQTASVGEVSRD